MVSCRCWAWDNLRKGCEQILSASRNSNSLAPLCRGVTASTHELGRGVRRRYDEWSAHMTDDVAFYVELAREADGPLVELAIGNGRVAIPVARATGQTGDRLRLVAGDARAGPGPRRPTRASTRPARGRHARPAPRRAGGADLLPVPRAAAPGHLGRPPPDVRAGGRLAAAGRSVRLERVRLRPPLRRPPRGVHEDDRSRTRVQYSVGDNRIDIVRDDGAKARCGGRPRTNGSG